MVYEEISSDAQPNDCKDCEYSWYPIKTLSMLRLCRTKNVTTHNNQLFLQPKSALANSSSLSRLTRKGTNWHPAKYYRKCGSTSYIVRE